MISNLTDKSNIRMFVTLMVIQIIAYATYMRINIYTGDDWNFAYNGYAQLENTFRLGRWFTGIIRMMLDQNSFVPVLSHLFALSVFACSAILAVRTWNVENKIIAGIAAALICVYPFNSDIIAFHIRHFTTTVGVLLSFVGAYLLVNADRRVPIYLLACAVLVLAYAVYQPLASNAVVIVLFMALYQLLNGKSETDILSELAIQFFVIAISVVVYFITFKISLEITGVNIAEKKAHYNIQTGNIQSVGQLIDNIKNVLFTTKAFYSVRTAFFPLIAKQIFIFLVLYVVTATSISKAMSYRRRLLSIILMVAILFSPWVTSMIRADFATRASMLFSFAIIYAGLIVLAYRLTNWEKLKRVIIVIGLFVVFIFVFQMTKSGYYREMQWIYDNNIASRVITRIENKGILENYKGKKKVPVYVHGRIQKPGRPFNESIERETFFTNASRSGVTDSQIIRFAKLLNLHSANKIFKFRKNLRSDNALKEKIKGMPKWPDDGSIKVIDGVIVVNLGFTRLSR